MDKGNSHYDLQDIDTLHILRLYDQTTPEFKVFILRYIVFCSIVHRDDDGFRRWDVTVINIKRCLKGFL